MRTQFILFMASTISGFQPQHGIRDLRRLQYIAPVTREGSSYALLRWLGKDPVIEILKYGEKFFLTLRVLGDPPSMKAIACMAKNKWDLTEKFHITRFLKINNHI